MTVLSVDPGDRVGWAFWDHWGRLLDHGIVDLDEFKILLRNNYFQSPEVVVLEQFRLQRHRAEKQSGSQMGASRCIGMLELYAAQQRSQLIKQELEARDMAYLHSGIPPAKNHANSHDLDAIMHGFYYWETLDLVPDLRVLSEESVPN